MAGDGIGKVSTRMLAIEKGFSLGSGWCDFASEGVMFSAGAAVAYGSLGRFNV